MGREARRQRYGIRFSRGSGGRFWKSSLFARLEIHSEQAGRVGWEGFEPGFQASGFRHGPLPGRYRHSTTPGTRGGVCGTRPVLDATSPVR